MTAWRREPSRGATPIEVLIVVAIVGCVVLLVLMALPRTREGARLASCEGNLMKIGQVVSYYDGAVGHLPAIPPPGVKGEGPLGKMLGQFGLGDLRDVGPNDPKWASGPPGTAAEHFVREFVCPSDTNARPGAFPAPVNYRANAGPGTDGLGGPFSFGQGAKVADAKAAAGADFTAAFAERLVGSGRKATSPVNDYTTAPGPVDAAACPPGPADSWRGDAGSSWAAADWTSTLYNHALTPNARPSCIAQDGRTARMGASSAHAGRVNVLMLGGSVRGFTPGVDLEVWRKFAGISAKDRVAKTTP